MTKDWNLPREGSCRCGAVRLSMTKPAILTAACHCRGCQKMSASSYSLTLMLPEDGLTVTAGEPVLGGLKGDTVRHFFCPSCMTWIFSKPQRVPGYVNLRATMLDDTSDIAPFIETWTDEKLAFAETGAPKRFPQFPAPEDMAPLRREFDEWTERRP